MSGWPPSFIFVIFVVCHREDLFLFINQFHFHFIPKFSLICSPQGVHSWRECCHFVDSFLRNAVYRWTNRQKQTCLTDSITFPLAEVTSHYRTRRKFAELHDEQQTLDNLIMTKNIIELKNAKCQKCQSTITLNELYSLPECIDNK